MELRDQLQSTLGDAYGLERELGGGGMSRVFVADDRALGRKVVVKVLPPEMAATVSTSRFKREITLAAGLQHPHIVPLLSAGDSGGLAYFTMPFVEGESLRARLARGGELPVAEGIRILREVASALDYAHNQGIVHRDIKPDNVLLSHGSAMVTDFGVAKALSASTSVDNQGTTSIGVALGTPAYMSPEQAAAAPSVDARADIYALGIMAYELFAGRPPFAGRSPQAILVAQISEVPELLLKLRPSLPFTLASLIMRCLEKHPADRVQTAAEVVQALDAITTPSGGSELARESPPRGTARVRSRPRTIALYAGGMVALGAASIVWPRMHPRTAPPASAGIPANASSVSVGVLPFVNLTDDHNAEYFSDGVTEDVLNALTKMTGLSVASRGSAFALKGKSLDAREVGRQLGVSHVVEGSIRRAGNRVRISVQLISARDNYQLWSENYDREIADIFSVQDEISRAIARALQARLMGGASAPLVTAPTNNIEAYDAYLQARFLWNHRNKAGIERAIMLFRQAIAVDSNYALAYAGLADAYAVRPQYANSAFRDDLDRAGQFARAALRLDSTLAEPHATLGFIHTHHYAWSDGEAEFKRVIAMQPSYATGYHWYSLLLRALDRLEESRAAIAQARKLDPVSRVIATVYGTTYYLARDYEKAITEYRRILSFDSTFAEAHRYLARSYVLKGDFVAAEQHARAAARFSGVDESKDLGFVLAHAGKRAEAAAILQGLIDRSRNEYVAPSAVAVVATALGQQSLALQWLARAIDEFDIGARDLKSDPRWDPLRADARFSTILAHANLR